MTTDNCLSPLSSRCLAVSLILSSISTSTSPPISAATSMYALEYPFKSIPLNGISVGISIAIAIAIAIGQSSTLMPCLALPCLTLATSSLRGCLSSPANVLFVVDALTIGGSGSIAVTASFHNTYMYVDSLAS